MLRKLPFRTKLILVVSVPLFALIGLSGVIINGRFTALSNEQQYGHVVAGFEALARAGRSVADEGVAAQWYIATTQPNPPADKALLLDTRNATDAAASALYQALPSFTGHVSPATLRQIDAVVTQLRALQTATRARVDEGDSFGSTFTDLADRSLTTAAAVARDIKDRDLSTSLLGIVDLRRSQVSNADEASIVVNWILGDPSDVAAWDAAIHDQATATSDFAETATAAEAHAYQQAVGPPPADPVRSTTPGTLPSAFPSTRPDLYTYLEATFLARQSNIDGGVNAVQAVVDHTAAVKESAARTELELAAAGTALLIALVLALAWALVQALNRPLRALTRAARNVSERRLPQLVDTVRRGGQVSNEQLDHLAPIAVDSNDEIGDLAKAFGNIQQVAVTVAREQAALLRKGIGDLYVNLARRNQSLLDRQLALLDDLERDAAEPDELAALFELDHLSTRMRRNAESLLVLSGSEQPRQWRSAIPIVDVVRAAGAEIADFARVSYVGFADDLAVAGHAVADVTHLLAELLENATAFSPPTTPVVAAGTPNDERYLVSITDQGLGIDDERLARINTLLARPPAPGLALSRTLGLFVVAHLAARHGILVQLRRAHPVGTTAFVALPATILARDVPHPEPGHTPPTRPAPTVEPITNGHTSWRATRPTRTPDRPAPDPTPTRSPDPPPARPEPHPDLEPVRAATSPPSGDGLPRRVMQPVTGRGGEPLATRVPGQNLSHRPTPPGPPNGETRPRPERVHDLLTRHSRGVQEGRSRPEDQ